VKPYCNRCQTAVILEQDGVSCSNCGTQLMTPIPPSQQRPTTHDQPATTANPTPTPAGNGTTRKGAA
jgi:hypothetical protein